MSWRRDGRGKAALQGVDVLLRLVKCHPTNQAARVTSSWILLESLFWKPQPGLPTQPSSIRKPARA